MKEAKHPPAKKEPSIIPFTKLLKTQTDSEELKADGWLRGNGGGWGRKRRDGIIIKGV